MFLRYRKTHRVLKAFAIYATYVGQCFDVLETFVARIAGSNEISPGSLSRSCREIRAVKWRGKSKKKMRPLGREVECSFLRSFAAVWRKCAILSCFVVVYSCCGLFRGHERLLECQIVGQELGTLSHSCQSFQKGCSVSKLPVMMYQIWLPTKFSSTV